MKYSRLVSPPTLLLPDDEGAILTTDTRILALIEKRDQKVIRQSERNQLRRTFMIGTQLNLLPSCSSTASLGIIVGFITLFGIATRNGIMLISHYSHLMTEESVPFRDAIVQGSMERLSPILMTALVTGVGLIPLALGVGQPGKEIQQPMAIVILGGIFTSTFLNMIVIPALYLEYSRAEAPSAARDYPHEREWAPSSD